MVPIIQVEGIQKHFDARPVLHDVSFTVNKGDIVGLLGPNGSGKTTIIRLLNGVIEATAGQILVNNWDPHTQGHEIRKISGILTDGAGLYHEMSGVDNLIFFGKLYGVNDEERIQQLLEDFQLADHQQKKVGTYSTGMKRRLGIIKAILHNPTILFLDEPTNGLDPEGIQMVLQNIHTLNKKYGTTIFLCSHILHQIESVCTQYLFLDHGTIIESGTKSELETKYIKEISVKIETNAVVNELNPLYKVVKQEGSFVTFILQTKDELPRLLEEILKKQFWIHHVEIQNRDLESLYFQIRGVKNEDK
ncbi:ABC transporter ATP-binding protein [Robertmurraya sp.]|uniref:ABC transporter ATP-binding protein n=1 Tax=Robertmurraya sp. TaxID=2837525 RepID=UPI0037048486